MSPRVLLLALVLTLAGCITRTPEMTSGNPIDPAKVSKIEKGKTTRAEVEVLLGKPDMTSMLPDGRRVASYNYSYTRVESSSGAVLRAAFTASGKYATGSTRTQTLQLYFSKAGVVEDYEFNDDIRDIEVNGDGSRKTTTR